MPINTRISIRKTTMDFTPFWNFISHLQAAIPFSTATWFVIAVLMFVVWLFYKANKNPKSPVNWEDMILDHKKVSPYKLGYLIGLIVGTFVIVQASDKGSLTEALLGVYLAYTVGGAGWMTYLNKNGAPTQLVAPPQGDHDAK